MSPLVAIMRGLVISNSGEIPDRYTGQVGQSECRLEGGASHVSLIDPFIYRCRSNLQMHRDELDVLALFRCAQFRTGDPHGSSHHVYIAKTFGHSENILGRNLSRQLVYRNQTIVGPQSVCGAGKETPHH
jgi:hypothetical protein